MDESYVSHHHVGLSGVGRAGRLRGSKSPDGHANRRSQSPRVRLSSTSLRLRTGYELDEHASSLVDWPNVSVILTPNTSKHLKRPLTMTSAWKGARAGAPENACI